jgi:hypothetical protein
MDTGIKIGRLIKYLEDFKKKCIFALALNRAALLCAYLICFLKQGPFV